MVTTCSPAALGANSRTSVALLAGLRTPYANDNNSDTVPSLLYCGSLYPSRSSPHHPLFLARTLPPHPTRYTCCHQPHLRPLATAIRALDSPNIPHTAYHLALAPDAPSSLRFLGGTVNIIIAALDILGAAWRRRGGGREADHTAATAWRGAFILSIAQSFIVDRLNASQHGADVSTCRMPHGDGQQCGLTKTYAFPNATTE